MKKTLVVLLLVVALCLTTVSLAVAVGPVGGCPDNFELHMHMEHEHGEGQHLHAGTSDDFNGDGFICVKHVSSSGNVHVHIDNYVPLP